MGCKLLKHPRQGRPYTVEPLLAAGFLLPACELLGCIKQKDKTKKLEIEFKKIRVVKTTDFC